MKSTFIQIAAALLATTSNVLAHGEPDLRHEHAGDVFSKTHGGSWHLNGVLHNGNSTGQTKSIGGGESIYIVYLMRSLTQPLTSFSRNSVPRISTRIWPENKDRHSDLVPDRHLRQCAGEQSPSCGQSCEGWLSSGNARSIPWRSSPGRCSE